MYKRIIELGKSLSNEYKKLGKDYINLSKQAIFQQAVSEMKLIKPEDFEFKANQDIYFLKNQISYSNIYQDPENFNFSVGIFFLSKNTLVPMHDHPQMFVFNQVVSGEAQFKQFKLEEKFRPMQFTFPHEVYIKEKKDMVLKPPEVEANLCLEGVAKQGDLDLVEPIERNIHTYKVKQNFSFLALQVPSYDFQNRFCNYYRVKSADKAKNKYTLQMIEQLEDYAVNIIQLDQKKCRFFA